MGEFLEYADIVYSDIMFQIEIEQELAQILDSSEGDE